MKFSTLAFSALAVFTSLAGIQVRADNMASLAIAPATGAVTLTPRWTIGGSLAGFHFMAQDLSLGGGPNQFYSIKSTAVPAGGDIAAFTRYIAASGAATAHADIGSKLTPNSYLALTSADPDLGFGSVQLYFIHRKTDGDYFSHIIPGSGVASAVTDLKPMSQPGGPSTGGASGYFGLTFSATDLGYGANLFYYLRTNPVTGFTKFGSLVPALAGSSTDQFDLGLGGHNALAFTGTDVGFGINKMYYLRLDTVTGFTILGTLHPGTGRASDIANLGSVYSTLTFVPGDTGFGTNQFYTTGAVNATWQSVSFAAIADRAISAGSFTVAPSASSALPLVLTVVSGSTGAASISGPVGGVFTVTPTAPGVIILQATQAGQSAPTAFESNMLRQSFTASGAALTPSITNNPLTAAATVGTAFNFTITASGSPTSYAASPLPAGLNIATATGAITGTPTAAGTTTVLLRATNATGTGNATLTVTVAAATAPPVITSASSAPATLGVPFVTYLIAATGQPTSYTASGLPAGLALNSSTGAISGTPTAVGTSVVLLTATNAFGAGNATLTIVVAAATGVPIFTSPATATGSIGTPIATYLIAATGLPTSYTAAGLPPGLTLDPLTGAINGTPTTAGTYLVTLTATNATGVSTATLTIIVTVTPTIPSSRIVAFSARSPAGNGDQTLIMGFIVSGSNTTLVVRGIGPALTPIGVPNALADSQLALYSGSSSIASNDDWGTSSNPAQLATETARARLFPLAVGSKDAALVALVNDGVYTARVNGANNTIGTALAEVYVSDVSNPTARLTAVSARMQVNTNEAILIAGLVIAGNAPKTVLIRGIGPTLGIFGVGGILADPQLTIFLGGTAIATNNDWGTGNNAAALSATFAQVGEFPLPAGSKDAALLMTLQPGTYTVQLSGVAATTGVALIEIYEVP